MRVVGLISGGKDSIWNLHYCRQFGHEVVCLANLAPPAGICELDSYMYQTVGGEFIDGISSALGLPLVRRVIAGAPKGTSSGKYVPQEGDEVEDLTLLLQDVLKAHPQVDAVSCGAILSEYQRVRVENVCSRLGLKVLCFLWRQEQPHLLRQMIRGQLDARIVKVACMGLDSRHVGASILDPAFAEHMMMLGRKWGVHVCGEGGEYESAVLDAPLYRYGVLRLPPDSVEAVPHPDGEADGVALLSLKAGFPVLEPKEPAASTESPQTESFPALAEYSSLRYYQKTYRQLSGGADAQSKGEACWTSASAATAAVLSQEELAPLAEQAAPSPVLSRVGSAELWVTSTLDAQTFSLASSAESAANQCDALLTATDAWLRATHSRSLGEAVFAEVQVADLGCFDSVNAAYGKHFFDEPPARVCIQTPLPAGLHLRLRLMLGPSASASTGGSIRVQSISTWAMASIGPYSQARRSGELLLSSGVLGLVPHSMVMPLAAEAGTAQQVPEGSEDDDEEDSSEEPAPEGTPEQWEAELWLLMRSLKNVLQVMGNNFGQVQVAQVYATPGLRDPRELCQRTLAYMRRDSPSCLPLISFAEVPRLPKGGCVEIAVICAGPVDEDRVRVEVPGAAARPLGSCGFVAVAEAFVLEESAAAGPSLSVSLRSAARRCVSSLLQSAGEGPGSQLTNLQVQYSLPSASEIEVYASVQVALQAAFGAPAAERCAISLMPVCSLRTAADDQGPQLRLIALGGPVVEDQVS
ncbi:unnamed protein product [Polarella glacialis]|uniref:Diphthine--ammonia ligase n=1 Tax=Polarella glacialis TaxID=89957 RepID=A0A813HRE4_POLGL|nr:unnamed protein product [Polarella glacialis]